MVFASCCGILVTQCVACVQAVLLNYLSNMLPEESYTWESDQQEWSLMQEALASVTAAGGKSSAIYAALALRAAPLKLPRSVGCDLAQQLVCSLMPDPSGGVLTAFLSSNVAGLALADVRLGLLGGASDLTQRLPDALMSFMGTASFLIPEPLGVLASAGFGFLSALTSGSSTDFAAFARALLTGVNDIVAAQLVESEFQDIVSNVNKALDTYTNHFLPDLVLFDGQKQLTADKLKDPNSEIFKATIGRLETLTSDVSDLQSSIYKLGHDKRFTLMGIDVLVLAVTTLITIRGNHALMLSQRDGDIDNASVIIDETIVDITAAISAVAQNLKDYRPARLAKIGGVEMHDDETETPGSGHSGGHIWHDYTYKFTDHAAGYDVMAPPNPEWSFDMGGRQDSSQADNARSDWVAKVTAGIDAHEAKIRGIMDNWMGKFVYENGRWLPPPTPKSAPQAVPGTEDDAKASAWESHGQVTYAAAFKNKRGESDKRVGDTNAITFDYFSDGSGRGINPPPHIIRTVHEPCPHVTLEVDPSGVATQRILYRTFDADAHSPSTNWQVAAILPNREGLGTKGQEWGHLSTTLQTPQAI
jgi:hypothetical protein